jgi:surfactin family lipopeptide synthetase A
MKAAYPLTEAQRRIWYVDELFSENSISNIAIRKKYHRDLNIDLMKKAIELFVLRNEMMHIRLVQQDKGAPLQYLDKGESVDIELVNLSNYSIHQLESWFNEKAREPFYLYKTKLYEFSLVIRKNEVFLFVKCHHIVLDGISIVLLVRNIEQLYKQLSNKSYIKTSDNYESVKYLV